MSALITLPLKEANLLRRRIRTLVKLRAKFLHEEDPETIHDLRVASRRLREVLDFLQTALPPNWYRRIKDLTRQIIKRLGDPREAEVNLKFLNQCGALKITDPATIEVLVYFQKARLRKRQSKTRNAFSRKRFSKLEVFLNKLKGSRTAPPTNSALLQSRTNDFLGFSWQQQIDDDRLHDLRIRTKKFRYAVEIHSLLGNRNLGRFLRRIKQLQDVLGEIHDLAVFQQTVKQIKEEWILLGLTVIPSGLQQIEEYVMQNKLKLYSRVYPLYASVIQNAPAELPLIHPVWPAAS